jgi:hypothetical protein
MPKLIFDLRNKIFFKECNECERRPFQAKCQWYQLCVNVIFLERRCSSIGSAQQQMFNPLTKNLYRQLQVVYRWTMSII